ncbi:threonine-phosphate decarboxylase CobD [Parasphingopyxis sp.]|uniref:threonine-phosphate decarboxylase CobD n=1 Tax=Parasphingopyxis sp. TaxID=1920299 RepID=UPI0026206FE7|nr:threonine-phosphate decarboxylase CobD [Parasphingopyxis sp.]
MTEDDLITGHGGRINAMARAFPDAPLPWIDLSTGISPFTYPLPAIAQDAWERLPTASARDACERSMVSTFGCDPAVCRAVAGTEIVIRQLPAVLGARRVALRTPSYIDHALAWGAAGAEILSVSEPLAMASEVDAIVIVNPNNPDGYRWPLDRIEAARETLAARNGWLIVDEAYADLEPKRSMAAAAGKEGLVVLRSFGKFFGLAGIRLGAVLAPSGLLERLDARLGDWDVSGPALSVGAAAYRDRDWQEATRERLRDASLSLREMLASTELRDIGGTDLFRFAFTSDAGLLWRQLAEQGIAIRRFAGDLHHVRIGLPGTDRSLARLRAALSL